MKTFAERLRALMQTGERARDTLNRGEVAKALKRKGVGSGAPGTLRNWLDGRNAPAPFIQKEVLKIVREMRPTKTGNKAR